MRDRNRSFSEPNEKGEDTLRDRAGKLFRAIVIAACAALTLFSMTWLLIRGEPYWIRCLIGLFVILFPLISEYLFSFRMKPAVFAVIQFYVLSFVLGKCFHVYEMLPWWDIVMHFWGGVSLSVVGVFFFQYLAKDHRTDAGGSFPRAVAAALSAVCFALAVGACWEMLEFAADRLFGWDMQTDTVIYRIDSLLIGERPWNAGTIEDVQETIVNGEKLPVSGYVDIGLYDTIEDLFSLAAGAVPVAVICLISKGKNVLFNFFSRRRKREDAPKASGGVGPEKSIEKNGNGVYN